MSAPTVTNLRKHAGIAGQFSVSATVAYPYESAHEGAQAKRVEFVGSVYGGPVVMISPSGVQTFVTDPSRFGEFGVEWVRRFFGSNDETTQERESEARETALNQILDADGKE